MKTFGTYDPFSARISQSETLSRFNVLWYTDGLDLVRFPVFRCLDQNGIRLAGPQPLHAVKLPTGHEQFWLLFRVFLLYCPVPQRRPECRQIPIRLTLSYVYAGARADELDEETLGGRALTMIAGRSHLTPVFCRDSKHAPTWG